jgi:hypothetical protein
MSKSYITVTANQNHNGIVTNSKLNHKANNKEKLINNHSFKV